MNLNQSIHPQSLTPAATRSVGKYRWTICALAYLVAWTVMKTLVPRHKEITDL